MSFSVSHLGLQIGKSTLAHALALSPPPLSLSPLSPPLPLSLPPSPPLYSISELFALCSDVIPLHDTSNLFLTR